MLGIDFACPEVNVFNPFILFSKLSCQQLKGLGVGLAELNKHEHRKLVFNSSWYSTLDDFYANYLTFLRLSNWLYLCEWSISKWRGIFFR